MLYDQSSDTRMRKPPGRLLGFLASVLIMFALSASSSTDPKPIFMLTPANALYEYDIVEQTLNRIQILSEGREYRSLSLVSDELAIARDSTTGVVSIDLRTGRVEPLSLSGTCPAYIKKTDQILSIIPKLIDGRFESHVYLTAFGAFEDKESTPALRLTRYSSCPVRLDDESFLFKNGRGSDTSYLKFDALTHHVSDVVLPNGCKPLISYRKDGVLCKSDAEHLVVNITNGEVISSIKEFGERYFPRLYLKEIDGIVGDEFLDDPESGNVKNILLFDMRTKRFETIVQGASLMKNGVARVP